MGNDFSGDYVDLAGTEQAENLFRPGFSAWEFSDASPINPAQRATSFLLDLGLGRIYSGAAPLAPLRKRDWAVLEDWFQPDSMAEIEADIHQNLLLRFPEPCWEDHIFEFLGEFL